MCVPQEVWQRPGGTQLPAALPGPPRPPDLPLPHAAQLGLSGAHCRCAACSVSWPAVALLLKREGDQPHLQSVVFVCLSVCVCRTRKVRAPPSRLSRCRCCRAACCHCLRVAAELVMVGACQSVHCAVLLGAGYGWPIVIDRDGVYKRVNGSTPPIVHQYDRAFDATKVGGGCGGAAVRALYPAGLSVLPGRKRCRLGAAWAQPEGTRVLSSSPLLPGQPRHASAATRCCLTAHHMYPS